MAVVTSDHARRALAGELYHAFTPELSAARSRCKQACNRYNNAGAVTRREKVVLWRDIVDDKTPLPPQLEDDEQDAAQFVDEPWIEGPIRLDYGINVRLGRNVYMNFNCTILDTCLVTIGSRTLLASNVSLYSATHPLDPTLRNGTKGPELGKEIHIGDDCFLGGNVTVCPGVRIGRGVTVGAGSVVTKDVPDMCVVAGNPARIIRWLDGKAVEKDANAEVGAPDVARTAPRGHQEADQRDTTTSEDAQDQRTNVALKLAGIGGRQALPANSTLPTNSPLPSSEPTEPQTEDERLMTRKEWEDEMGRQIAEKSLLYGASMK